MTPGWTIVIKSISSQRFSPSVSRIAIEKKRERERQRERDRERSVGRRFYASRRIHRRKVVRNALGGELVKVISSTT